MLPRLPAHLHSTPLATQPFVFLCAPSHPLADRRAVNLETVAGEPFVDFDTGAAIRSANDHAFGAANLERRVRFQVDRVSALLDLVAQGLGVAIAPQYFPSARENVRSVPLSDGIPVWTFCAVTPTARLIPPNARKMLETVVAACSAQSLEGTSRP
jgi:DNA-binding transcriptional LysR family regulator